MVWNNEESPLYRSVERFNGQSGEHTPPPVCEAEHNSCGASARNTGRNGNFLQKITGDKDFLLIALLIVLLWQEKADFKLIAALAFILLA